MQTLWTFETAQLRVEWAIAPDECPDLSWDETGETREKLASGAWKCFISRMQCIHKATGAVLAEDYLGGSIYAQPLEFRDHIGAQGRWGSYFKDMVLRVCTEARAQLRTLQGMHIRAGGAQ